MKSKVFYYLILMLYFCKFERAYAGFRKVKNQKIDPISDFRVPYSLTEMLHEGLSKVAQICQDLTVHARSDSPDAKLHEMQEQIQSMSGAYAQMADSSNLHMVYRDDKDFLQSLIDRIDAMIQDLERSPELNDAQKNILKSNVGLLNQLKTDLQG